MNFNTPTVSIYDNYNQTFRQILHIHSPTNVDCLTCHVSRQIRSQEYAYLCNIFRSTASLQWNFSSPLLTHVLGQLCGHIGNDKSRSNSVSTNITRAKFFGHALRESDNPGFRCSLVCLSGITTHSYHGTHADNGTRFLT